MRRIGIALLLIWMLAPVSHGEDARAIMKKVLDRNDGTTEISRVRLSTCRYVKKGKRYVCADKPRVKLMDQVRKDYGPDERDHRSVTVLIEPKGEQGIGFLQYDYEDREMDTDQWMYLSALGKVKRIVSGNDNEPKTGSFFGSEISYEDMEMIHLEDYTYKLLGEETYVGRACYVIESLPVEKKARKSNYSKSLDWVDKENTMVLKTVLYNRQGQKIKRIYMGKIEAIDGILVARQMVVNNLETKRRTLMVVERVAFNKMVEDQFLTQRTLTDKAYRAGHMKKYQKYVK